MFITKHCIVHSFQNVCFYKVLSNDLVPIPTIQWASKHSTGFKVSLLSATKSVAYEGSRQSRDSLYQLVFHSLVTSVRS